MEKGYVNNGIGHCFYESWEDKVILYGLYVDSGYRRMGYATSLIVASIAKIRRDGYNGDIVIEAIPEEDSIPREDLVLFYERMGLKVLPLGEDGGL